MRLTRAGSMIGALALTSVLAACGTSTSSTSGGAPQASPTEAMGEQSVTLTAKDFMFDPATFSVVAGKSVTIKVTNTGTVQHNFTLDDKSFADKDLNVDLDAGKTVDITFTPKKAGSAAFHCEYHASKGMKGTITITGGTSSTSGGSKYGS